MKNKPQNGISATNFSMFSIQSVKSWSFPQTAATQNQARNMQLKIYVYALYKMVGTIWN